MRHVWSLLAGLVAAPLAWLCLATGQYRSQQVVAGWYAERFFDTRDLIGPVAFLAAAGIVLGLLGTLRWSPLGPVAAGLVFVAPTGFMFRDPFRTLEVISLDAPDLTQPRRLLGLDLQPWLPVENGTLLVLGALLLMAVFSARRWRRWPRPEAAQAGQPGPALAAGTLAPSGVATATGTPAATAATPGVAPAPRPEPAAERVTLTDDEILAEAQRLEVAEAAAAQDRADEDAAADEPAGADRAEPGSPQR